MNALTITGLTQDMVCAKFAHTASDGRIYETMF